MVGSVGSMKKKDKEELLDEILADAHEDLSSANISNIIDCPSEDFVRLRPKKDTTPEVVEKKELIPGDNDLEDDVKYIRENLHQVIEQNQQAIKDLLGFAQQGQSARSYEVVAALIKTLNESNKDLLELYRTKNKIEEGPSAGNGPGPKSVHQTAIFLGSTNDLDEMLSDAIKKMIPVDATVKK